MNDDIVVVRVGVFDDDNEITCFGLFNSGNGDFVGFTTDVCIGDSLVSRPADDICNVEDFICDAIQALDTSAEYW